MKNKYILPVSIGLITVASFGVPISVFAEEKDIPVNITVNMTPINVTLPTSIELANAGDTADVVAASSNKIINNANTGVVHIDSIDLEILNGWSLGDKTAKYEEMPKDSKHLYLGMKLSDEADFVNLKESYKPINKEIEAKSEKGLLFEGKTNITSSKLVNQIGNLVITVKESENVVQNGNLKRGFLGPLDSPYIEEITELSFVTTQDGINSSASWDASVEGDGSVMAWTDKNDATKVFIGAKNGKVMAPEDSSGLLESYSTEYTQMIDVTNLDVSNVTNMSQMFYSLGSSVASFKIKGLDTWDVSNVTDMSQMFYCLGVSATSFEIKGLDMWNVSNVTNMHEMFIGLGQTENGNFDMGDISNWDVSNVTDMSGMFDHVGSEAMTFHIGDISNWDVSNVMNMSGMFSWAGLKATAFDIGDISKWNVSKVMNMSNMFSRTGNAATIFDIGNLGNWNVSNVTDMSGVFQDAGSNATTFNIGDLSKWNVSNVTSMSSMFQNAGSKAATFNIGDLSKWNVSNVTDMMWMFENTGKEAINFHIGNLENWNVSNVIVMTYMFDGTGVAASFVPPSWAKYEN